MLIILLLYKENEKMSLELKMYPQLFIKALKYSSNYIYNIKVNGNKLGMSACWVEKRNCFLFHVFLEKNNINRLSLFWELMKIYHRI